MNESSTRFQLTVDMLGSVLLIAIIVMVLAAFGVPVPDFVSGVILTGFMMMLKDAYASYFKAREEHDAAELKQKTI